MAEGISAPCIAVDLPGFGHSDPSPHGSVSGYARDVADVLEMLGIERFTLVGHSLGGAVAAALVELIPSRASSLELLAPAGARRECINLAWNALIMPVLYASGLKH